MPVVSAERRILGSIEPISASSRVPIPRLPIRARNVAVDTAAAAMPTSRAENVRVAMAQYARPRTAVAPGVAIRYPNVENSCLRCLAGVATSDATPVTAGTDLSVSRQNANAS